MASLAQRSKYATISLQEDDEIAQKLHSKGMSITSLNIGDPTIYFKTPAFIIESYIKALKQNRTNYSNPLGIIELREAVVRRYKRLYNVDIHADDILITQGVSEALMCLNAALIDDKDRAMIFKPYFTPYFSYLKLYGGNEIVINCDKHNNWQIDIESIRKKLKNLNKDKIKYLILSNPNNPTGSVSESKTLKEIVEIANEYDILIISDEIYDEIIYNKAKFTSISQIANGVPHVILNGSSKNYNSTGFRIGLAIIKEEDKLSKDLKKKMRDFASLRLSANTPAQYAIAEAMDNINEHKKTLNYMTKSIERNVKIITNRLNQSIYMHAVMPNGAFYIFPEIYFKKLTLKDDREFVKQLLIEEQIQLARGSGFGMDNHVRIVALAPLKTLYTSIEKIDNFCKRHSK